MKVLLQVLIPKAVVSLCMLVPAWQFSKIKCLYLLLIYDITFIRLRYMKYLCWFKEYYHYLKLLRLSILNLK